MKIKHLLATIVIFYGAFAEAQTSDYGMWYSFGVKKKLNKWQFESEAELRTLNQWDQVSQWNINIEPSYQLFKPLTVGLGYKYISYHDFKYDDYQPRNRIYLFATGKVKLNDFKLSLRESVQMTTKDESDRIKKDGSINTYKINPAWIWRNRLRLDYNIPKCSWNPAVSIETFYQMNNPDGNQFSKVRYELMLYYNLSKQHHLKIYGLLNEPVNEPDAASTYVGGLGYYISF